MATVKRWGILENNVVVNIIIADEDFIKEQGFDAIADDLIGIGARVENDTIIHLTQVALISDSPEIVSNVENPSEELL